MNNVFLTEVLLSILYICNRDTALYHNTSYTTHEYVVGSALVGTLWGRGGGEENTTPYKVTLAQSGKCCSHWVTRLIDDTYDWVMAHSMYPWLWLKSCRNHVSVVSQSRLRPKWKRIGTVWEFVSMNLWASVRILFQHLQLTSVPWLLESVICQKIVISRQETEINLLTRASFRRFRTNTYELRPEFKTALLYEVDPTSHCITVRWVAQEEDA